MNSHCRRLCAFALVCIVGGLIENVACADPGPAAGRWVGDFRAGDVLGDILDLHVHDGNLYAAGSIETIDSQRSSSVVRLNGTTWESLGGDEVGGMTCLATFQGSLHAAGQFRLNSGAMGNALARWNGAQWEVAPGTDGLENVLAMTEFQGGLYIAALGLFQNDQFTLDPVLRWDGTTLSRLPSSGSTTLDLVTFGGSLYAATYRGVTRWSGSEWESTGFPSSNGVTSLVEHQGRLFAATNGWHENRNIVWVLSGDEWSPVPSEVVTGGIRRLISTPQGVIALGDFQSIDATPVSAIALWDGRHWNALGSGLWPAAGDAAYLEGVLYAAGDILGSGPKRINKFARFDGSSWFAFNGAGSGLTSSPKDAVVHDGQLVAVGGWIGFGESAARSAAGWNGRTWTSLGGDPNVYLDSIASTGSGLYASGVVALSGGYSIRVPLFRRLGGSWELLSLTYSVNGFGNSLVADGEDVIILGELRIPWVNGTPDITTSSITRFAYNGGWTPLGRADGSIDACVVTADGYIVAGAFTSIDGTPANQLAIRTPQGWQEYAGGITDDSLHSLAYSRGTLYVATSHGVRSWDGQVWKNFTTTYSHHRILCVYDGRVFAAGDGSTIFEVTDDSLVPIPGAPDGWTYHLTVYDDGQGPSMYAMGQFAFADGKPAARIAQYTTGACRADANHDRRIDGVDLAVLLSGFGKRTSNPYEAADFTGDTRVNADDLTILLSRFGDSCE